jgi:thioredoxin reductase (NADPH)
MLQEESNNQTEIAIIGAGPIGIELAVCLKRAGVNYIHFDAQQMGYTISWWPRNTHFFSTTERIAIAGIPIQNNYQDRITGEDYLAYLRAIVERYDLQINTYEKVGMIERDETGFTLRTGSLTGPRTYRSRRVVLAKGDMDKPNFVHVSGEDLPHVNHYFIDPHLYFRKRLLVVGGKNSAVEAALRCWRSGAEVAISYRRAMFGDRVKPHLLPDLQAQIDKGNIRFYPDTVPIQITPEHVVLGPTKDGKGENIIHQTDFVLLCTGFVADMKLHQMAGVEFEDETGQPKFNPDTMETNVPGLYVAGTTAAGERQKSYRLFIENSHEHVVKIVKDITGKDAIVGTIPARNYELALKEFQAN